MEVLEQIREDFFSTHAFWPLIKEIDKLKQTLCELDINDSTFSIRIKEHVKKLQARIIINPGDISCVVKVSPTLYAPSYYPPPGSSLYCPYPLCRLFNKDKFCPKEIPLSILELLVMAGFDVNGTSYKIKGETCLHSAIDAVRWLVEHGADCNVLSHKNLYPKTPIVSLASRPNVPLDLFDLLKTPENLNDGRNKRLPLHEALCHGCINSALYLISLGAEVNNIDAYYECLPVECYIFWASEYHVQERFEFQEELYIKLLPSSYTNTIEIIHKIMLSNFEFDVASKMVYSLLQRHVKTGNISLSIRAYRNHDYEYRIFYLKSLLVLLLDLDLPQMPDIAKMTRSMTEESWKQTVVNIWKAYDQRHGKVKSLFKLCIQCTRNSMSSLDDDSFQSLPLPSKLQNFLMLWDVAEVICEAWKLWPKCVIIEDIVNNYL